MFRNLTFFRFPQKLAAILAAAALTPTQDERPNDLQAALAECPAKPCGPLELASRGWVSPLGSDSPELFHPAGSALLLTLGGEDKILPGAALAGELAKRLRAYREREGREAGAKVRKALRDDVLTELLPRALVKPYRLQGYLDLARGLVVVDTGSRKAAEDFVGQLRRTLGSFPALPLTAEAPPRAVLTDWLGGAELPEGWAIGDSCNLAEAADGSTVKFAGHDDLTDSTSLRLEMGEQCTRLGLYLGERAEFMVDEELTVLKFKHLDGALQDLADTADARDEPEEAAAARSAELSARTLLLSAEVGGLFDALAVAMKLTPPDETGEVALDLTPRRAAEAEAEGYVGQGDEEAPVARQGSQDDPLYGAAVDAVLEEGRVSVSMIQRRLKIGYNRAAWLVETMEARGFVSPPAHDGARRVLGASRAEA